MDLAIIMLIGFVSLLNLVLAYVCLLHRKSQTEVFLAAGLVFSVIWNTSEGKEDGVFGFRVPRGNST